LSRISARGSDARPAVSALAALVGAVSMLRAVNDPALSREILKAAADTLKQQLA
jgi:hypothetical protein